MYDPMSPKKLTDSGYIVAWKFKYQFETGKLPGEMTYGEAMKKARELEAKNPEKTFWAEKPAQPFKAHG